MKSDALWHKRQVPIKKDMLSNFFLKKGKWAEAEVIADDGQRDKAKILNKG